MTSDTEGQRKMTLLHDEPNEAPITEIYVFLSTDMTGEGICAAMLQGLGSTPLITSKARIAERMKGKAVEVSRLSGLPVRLVRFTRAETIWSSEQSS